MDNTPYFTKRDTFYYLEVCDTQIKRDNLLSSLFGEDIKRLFIGSIKNDDRLSVIDDLKYARYFKDERAAIRKKHEFASAGYANNFEVREMDADTFINIIPDKYENINFISKKNSRLKYGMIKSMGLWNKQRVLYKAIQAYKRVSNPSQWLPCFNCGLIPLTWEFNNGRSTACGCGKNEYDHFSIQAESIISYVTRNNGSASGYNSDELRSNWNKWVTNKK